MPKPVHDQVIVITGASSGIGLATADLAASRGAKVVLAARNLRDLEHSASELQRLGADAVPVATDVTDPAQVEHLAQQAVERFGRIDTWVNDAAVSLYGRFEDLDLQDFRRVLEVNLMGQVHGARAALPHLERTDGALICVGSVLSDRGIPLQSAYVASKHAVKGWLDSLRSELLDRGSGVRLTLIKPASINTPLFRKAKTELGVQPMPLPPVYEPEEVAEAILEAAEGRVRERFVGSAGRALGVLDAVAPRLVDRRFAHTAVDGQKTSWPKAPDGPHNLYAPVPHDGGVHGEFRRLSGPDRTPEHPGRTAGVMALALVGAWAAMRALRTG